MIPLNALKPVNAPRLDSNATKLRVALVNPPFGPGVLPNLGLALLSSSIQSRGFSCRTFYWNLEMVEHFRGNFQQQMRTFAQLTGKPWFPFNEWIFSGQLYDGMDKPSSFTLDRMKRETNNQPKAEEIRNEIVSLRERSPEIVSAMVEQLESFDLIAISSTFLQNIPALALARSTKARWPNKTVVLGGANCDGEMGQGLLAKFPFLDFTFSGEMDFTFADFLCRFSRGEVLHDLPGVNGRRLDGSLFAGPSARPVEVMDSLPTPDFDDYVRAWDETGHADHHKLILAMESSRGCWWGERHHCTFCGLNANGMGYRRKSDERFISEIETVARKYGTKYLYLADNILPMEFYDGFMKWARENKLELNFFYEIKSNVKRVHVEKMAAAGINSVQPGIESFSTNILKLMRKGVTGIHNVMFLRLAREHGILAQYSLLAGFPQEDQSEYAAMAKEIPKLSHLQPPLAMAEIEFHRFSPYHTAPSQFGLTLKPSWHYDHLYPFEKEEISKIAYVFEHDVENSRPRRYLKPVAEQLRRWGQSFNLEACTLIWIRDGDDIVITDVRPGYGPKKYRLQQFAVNLFLFLEEPHSFKSIVDMAASQASPEPKHTPAVDSSDEILISFTREEFRRDPANFLGLFDAAALVFTEQIVSENPATIQNLVPAPGVQPSKTNPKQYVFLPVPAAFRKVQSGWLNP